MAKKQDEILNVEETLNYSWNFYSIQRWTLLNI